MRKPKSSLPGPERLVALGRAVLDIESRAIRDLLDHLDDAFAEAAQCMLACNGEIRPYRRQDCRDLGEHRLTGIFRSSGRSQPRGYGHDHVR